MQTSADATTDRQNRLNKRTALEQALKLVVPDYALVFFEHLHSEYLALKPGIGNQQLIDLLESLYEKRVNLELTWSDIYTFDLALVNERPVENLIRKAYDLRSKYRSIAGEKEYAEYLASKPPELTAILIRYNNQVSNAENAVGASMTSAPQVLSSADNVESDQILSSAEGVTRVLRADVLYLLSKFYLYYTMLPMREQVREHLMAHTIRVTVGILVLVVVMMALTVGGTRLVTGDAFIGSFAITAGAVVLAGIIGGCISMLQRIQNAPVEGDVWFNLAALSNRWRVLSLSPVYGAVFAWLLFVLFAAGILQGPAFPKIVTVTSDTNINKLPQTQSGDAASSANANTTPTPLLTATQRTGIVQFKDLLRQTGPADGVSFALLLIWSFIAGFAERLVPDILNRFIAKSEAIQDTQT